MRIVLPRVLEVQEHMATAQSDAELASSWRRRKQQVNGSDKVAGTERGTVSRRALRNGGVTGSNQALNALTCMINAEQVRRRPRQPRRPEITAAPALWGARTTFMTSDLQFLNQPVIVMLPARPH